MKISIFGITCFEKMKIVTYRIFHAWYMTMDSENLNFKIMKGEKLILKNFKAQHLKISACIL